MRAVSNTFRLANSDEDLIAALIPPGSLRDGRNTVEVYEVTGSQLARMGGTD